MKHLHPLFHPLFTSLCLVIIIGCSKYQVVSEIQPQLYHLHDPKKKDAEIIMTKDSLIIGKFYKLKDINIIDIPYYSRPKLKSR